ncbi:GIY-YIG nuclease family protein [Haloarcula salinisoli]|uniref:GIY-YIG nuclease family protein n=1 Tax=Haloarcula salinisoli TaxID=2487746 RepID=A0A8J8CCV1_9EURY|nr:GIY-YIG nuclease family protein [Halomicroarcula salinisoli]MBX0305698.1 GIY-YIG nuclease family protein [Halomicroarcula salinisoli]
MTASRTKDDLWDSWVEETILADITDPATPDPVPMLDERGAELDMTDAYDEYRLGRGSGDYLYVLYLFDESKPGPAAIRPVYIGESGNVASRLLDHFRKLRDALPIADWTDDGSWGSFGKYDHIATVVDHADAPLCAWVIDTEDLETGPYGYPTYRHELEAKLVGLVHSSSRFDRIFANRDFVPNRVPQQMAQVGPAWVEYIHETPNSELARDVDGLPDTKAGLWDDWLSRTLCRDIADGESSDPIPLFATDENRVVELTERGGLKRSDAIDARIRQEGSKCVTADGVADDFEGLLYIMYQLDGDGTDPADLVPRYIGKAEAYGKKNAQSANFEEIAKERDATRAFARWGDGDYWHMGELSNTVFGRGEKKLSWASELFEQGTHQLEDQTYLWVRAWGPETSPGPYGYPATLAEVEPLLVGLAYAAAPGQLLNHNEVPDDAPANRREYTFEPAEE